MYGVFLSLGYRPSLNFTTELTKINKHSVDADELCSSCRTHTLVRIRLSRHIVFWKTHIPGVLSPSGEILFRCTANTRRSSAHRRGTRRSQVGCHRLGNRWAAIRNAEDDDAVAMDGAAGGRGSLDRSIYCTHHVRTTRISGVCRIGICSRQRWHAVLLLRAHVSRLAESLQSNERDISTCIGCHCKSTGAEWVDVSVHTEPIVPTRAVERRRKRIQAERRFFPIASSWQRVCGSRSGSLAIFLMVGRSRHCHLYISR